MRTQRKSFRGMLIAFMCCQLLLSVVPAALCQTASTTVPANSGIVAAPKSLTGPLSVGSGSTLVIDVGQNTQNQIKLSGNLTNAGTIYVLSSNPDITHASISAMNILNSHGALFTSILPAGGITGFTSLVPNLGLTLMAINNIVNYGTISSSGSLNLTAGNSIINQLPAGMTGLSPTIMALQNLNLQANTIINSGLMSAHMNMLNAYTGNLTNSGVMEALSGHINVQNLLGNILQVNNSAGVMKAATNIEFSTLGSIYDANKNVLSQALLEITGGALQAPKISLTSPGGKLVVAVDQITGGLTLSGGTAAVGVSSGGLTIASANLSGDPIFYANGTLDLSGLFASNPQYATFGGDFVALSTGDIIAPLAPLGASINAQAQVGPGGSIFIDAGTNFTVTHPGCSNCRVGIDYTLGTPSTTGGSIKLAGVDLVTNCNSITLLAHNGFQQEGNPTFLNDQSTRNPGSISIGNITACCDPMLHPEQTESFNQFINIVAAGNLILSSVTNTNGSINAQSLFGNLNVLANQAVQAFGGGVSLIANQNLQTGNNVTVNAVGGDVSLVAQQGTLCTGSFNTLGAYATGSTGGFLSLQSRGDLKIGSNNTLSGDNGISVTSTCQNIRTGSDTSFHTCKEDIKLTAEKGCIVIGNTNTMNAVGGDIIILSAGHIVTGSGSTFNAFNDGTQGGSVLFTSTGSNVTIGNANLVNAVGGDLNVTAFCNVTVQDGSELNAFHQGTTGGSVALAATHGNLRFGQDNSVNAVGGDLHLSAGKTFTSGANNEFNAFTSGMDMSAVGGHLTLSTGGNILIGDNNTFVGGKDVHILTSCGKIQTGKGDMFHACKGDVELLACKGDICLGPDNRLEANGGNVILTSRSIVTGANNVFNAWNECDNGGNIVFTATHGSTYIGRDNEFNAVGGNVNVTARKDVFVDDGTTINAFDQNGTGGSVWLTAQTGDITLDKHVTVNAVGGNIRLNAIYGGISTGDYDKFSAFKNDPFCCTGYDGQIVFASKKNISIGQYNALVAGNGIDITSGHGNITTGRGSTFLACCDDIKFTAYRGSIRIGSDNKMTANSGDIILRSASYGSGNVTTGSGSEFNAFKGKTGGGDVKFIAAGGDVTVGNANKLNADGGDVNLLAYDDVSVGADTAINAFHETGSGGNVVLTASHGDISAGDNDKINAVGGDVTLTANHGTITTGNNVDVNAFATDSGGGGDITATAKYNVTFGNNNNLSADQDMYITSAVGNVATGSGTRMHTCDGDIKLVASCGRVKIGNANDLSADGGDISLAGAAGVTTGDNDTFNAFKEGTSGGNVTFTSTAGSITTGATNIVNAVGGNVTLSAYNNITTGPGSEFNAYRQTGTGGDVSLAATQGNIAVGADSKISAVGGNITGTANNGMLALGANDALTAFSSGNPGAGNITLTSKGDLSLAAGDELGADGGNITLTSTGGAVTAEPTVDLCTFNPIGEGTGNVEITAQNNLVLAGVEIGAVNNITLRSLVSDVLLTADTLSAGGDTAGGSILVTSGDDLTLTYDNILFAYQAITLAAGGDVTFGSAETGNNKLCAVQGDVNISGKAITLGLGDSIESHNGSVTLTAVCNLTLGQLDLLKAGGGDLSLISTFGDVNLGSFNELDAFFNLTNPLIGGSIYLTAPAGTVFLGSNNDLNAIGGDIHINALHTDFGTGNMLCTSHGTGDGGGTTVGDVFIVVPGDLVLTDESLTVQGNLTLSGATVTLTDNTLIAFGGNLGITGTLGDVQINEGNILAAFSTAWVPGSTGPVVGGNVFITSARDINFFAPEGGIGAPEDGPHNIVQAVGGNIVMSAARQFEAKFDNVFIASSLLPDGSCGPGGGFYIFTGGADVFPLPTTTPGVNVFEFSDQHVNIDPNPPSFSPETTPAGTPIHQESGGGGDPTIINVLDEGKISLNSGGSLIHILSDDLLAQHGIIYMATGNGQNDKSDIQFKDNTVSAGCVPIIIPPPPFCPPPSRPDCLAPVLSCQLPTPPTPPTPPVCPEPQVVPPQRLTCPTPDVTPPAPPPCPTAHVTPPTPPACPTPPTPPDCPTPPVPPPVPPNILGGNAEAQRGPLPAGTVQLPPFTIVGNQCLAFYLTDAPSSYLQSTQGTKIAVAGPHAVSINGGQSLVSAGEHEMTIQAGDAQVTLPANGVTVIDNKSGDMTTVTSLGDADPIGMDINVNNQNYNLKPGEQLLIGRASRTRIVGAGKASGAVFEAGVATGKTGSELQGGVTSPQAVYVLKAAADLPEFIPKMGILQTCRECAFRNYLKNKTTQSEPGLSNQGIGMVPQENNMANAAGNNNAPQRAKDNSHLVPVAYTATVLPKNVVASGNADLVPIGADHFQLRRGNVLITAKRATRIDTDFMSVYAKPGAILLLTANRQLSRVRDLCDKHTGDVRVVVGKQYIDLRPGKELAVSNAGSDPMPLVLADGMARRSIQQQTVGKFTIVTDEFSLLTALMKHPLLYQLRQSKDVLDTRTLDEVNKIAAVVNLVFDRGKGPYFASQARLGTGIAEKPVEPIY